MMMATKYTLTACVMFSGRLRLESTGEDVGKASSAQVARSYSAGNPSVSVTHSAEWWKANAPIAYARHIAPAQGCPKHNGASRTGVGRRLLPCDVCDLNS